MALAGALGYALVVKVLSPEFIAPLFNIKESVNDGFSKMDNSNVFIGIIIGLIAAYCYNKFSDVELPTLSFFSGKRLVPIMTVFYCTFLIAILLFAWPFIYSIVAFGKWLIGFGPFGAFLYGFFNRLLIPTGLHHALNVCSGLIRGINDIGKFQTGQDAIKGITGRYQAGFFPIMMFGMPCALAMYHTANLLRKTSIWLVYSKFHFCIYCWCN